MKALVALTACAVLLTAGEAAHAQQADQSALRQEIEGLNRGMEAAVMRGALLEAAAFYADDAIVRTSNSITAQGRAAVDRYFTSIAGAKSWKLDVKAIGGPSNQPYQVGRSTLVHGTRPDTSIVDFLVIWKRQPDGKLKIMLDYYHSVPRTPPSQSQAEQEVRRLDEGWARSYAVHDTAFALALMSNDIIITATDGSTKTKMKEMEDIRPNVDTKMDYFRTSDVTIRVVNESAAVVSGLASWKFTYKGRDSAVERRYTATYVRGGALGWRMVGLQLGRAPTLAPGQ